MDDGAVLDAMSAAKRTLLEMLWSSMHGVNFARRRCAKKFRPRTGCHVTILLLVTSKWELILIQ